MEISIIIPAHNEAAVIKKTIADFLRAFPKCETIIVDDRSIDRTYEVVRSIRDRRVRAIRLAKRSGKGAAVMKGVALARKKLIAFADADNAFGSDSLKKLVSALDGYDCAIASKWKGKKFSEVEGNFSKKIFGRFWNLLSRTLLGLEIEDTQAGLKLFRANAIKGIELFGRGFEFDAEILYKLKRDGFKIREVFIRPKNARKSSFSYLNIPPMFLNIILMAVMLKFSSKSRKR